MCFFLHVSVFLLVLLQLRSTCQMHFKALHTFTSPLLVLTDGAPTPACQGRLLGLLLRASMCFRSLYTHRVNRSSSLILDRSNLLNRSSKCLQQIDQCGRPGPVRKEIACKHLRYICCNSKQHAMIADVAGMAAYIIS